MKEKIRSKTLANITRVESLVSIYESMAGTGSGRRNVGKTDILRAAVVLLHASLEDFLRALAYWKLSSANKHVLDKIPIVGIGRHAGKILLGDLAAHGSKKISTVIEESIDSHLEHSNYNNAGEIAKLLSDIGIDPQCASNTYPTLENLTARRHHIVHRADKNERGGRGNHGVRGINKGTVQPWINAVKEFVEKVLGAI